MNVTHWFVIDLLLWYLIENGFSKEGLIKMFSTYQTIQPCVLNSTADSQQIWRLLSRLFFHEQFPGKQLFLVYCPPDQKKKLCTFSSFICVTITGCTLQNSGLSKLYITFTASTNSSSCKLPLFLHKINISAISDG